jgi:hypothetical protein
LSVSENRRFRHSGTDCRKRHRRYALRQALDRLGWSYSGLRSLIQDKTVASILRIITITTAVLVLIGISWLLLGKLQLINTQEVSKSFNQFINLEAADEYVIARLETNEEFITEKYNYVMGFPVGDTNVKLVLSQHCYVGPQSPYDEFIH